MAVRTRDQLKAWFTTGAKPLQAQFWDWIDSFRHVSDKIAVADLDPTLAALIDALPTAAAIAALVDTKADLVAGKLKDSQVPDYLLSSSTSMAADGSFITAAGSLLEYIVLMPDVDMNISIGTVSGSDDIQDQQLFSAGTATVCVINRYSVAAEEIFINGVAGGTLTIKTFKRV